MEKVDTRPVGQQIGGVVVLDGAYSHDQKSPAGGTLYLHWDFQDRYVTTFFDRIVFL